MRHLLTVLAIAVSAALGSADDNYCPSPPTSSGHSGPSPWSHSHPSPSSHSPPSPSSYSRASPSGPPKPASSGCVNSPTDRQCWNGPWGNYDINTDYYLNTPNTGKIAEYWLTVDNVTMAPDGVMKNMYVFNNSFPGPTLEANWGDTFVIHVKNNLQDNGTSIHWHGFLQHGTAANDGVPGVTQCPIPPGESFTYTFRASSYGTTWYHSHFSLQYTNGLIGALVVNGPSSANWDIDLGPLGLADHYHTPAFTAYYAERSKPGPADNALFNGMNTWNSTPTGPVVGEKYEMKFTPGKKHRIRVINMSTDSHFKFSIDQHVMTVQAADFVAIEPYQTTVLNIFIGGQRYDIIVEADQAVDSYWMRLVATAGCSNVNNTDLTAIIRYDGVSTTEYPASTAYIPSNKVCEDETQLVPIITRNAGPFSYGSEMNITLATTNNIFSWVINNATSFRIDWEDPTLLMVDDYDPTYPAQYNVVELNGTQTTWVYFVVQSGGIVALNHPIHMHGHDFLLLGSGSGTFDYAIDFPSLNLTNPARRDVVTLPKSSGPAGGWLVIGFPLDNPGIWMIHCHIAWHVSEGLAMQFVERLDEIPGNVGVTSQWDQNCKAWQNYQDTYKPLEIDSGI